MNDSNINMPRREFLQKLLIVAGGAGASLALGGAAAYAKARFDAAQNAASDVSALQSQVGNAAQEIEQLRSALTSSEANLADTRHQLSASLTKNAELQNALADQQTQLLTLQAELANAQDKVVKLAQLIALYDKLESLNIDSIVQSGLTIAASAFSGLLGLAPLVGDGVRLAQTLLDGFEAKFPLYRAGVDWLKNRMDSLSSGITAVEEAIASAMSSLDPIASRMTQLIDHILKNLPFGIGQSVRNALEAINNLYQFLPDTIAGAKEQVVNTLAEPFNTSERGLTRTLLQPVREKALVPAEKLVGQVRSANDIYRRDLHEPVSAALTQRAEVWREIMAYLEANPL